MASKYKCAIIVVEQLRKDRSSGKRPDDTDIQGGAGLVQKATKIIMLYKFIKANPVWSANHLSTINMNNFLEFIVLKDRARDIEEKIYILETKNGIKQPGTNDKLAYAEYVFMGAKK